MRVGGSLVSYDGCSLRVCLFGKCLLATVQVVLYGVLGVRDPFLVTVAV